MTDPTHPTAPPRKHRRSTLAAGVVALCLVGIAFAAPRPFRQYPGVEYYDFELPTDYLKPAEWTFARLMYPTIGWGNEWQFGGTSWTIDYPRADRHVAEMVRRLTVIDARSVEQPVNLEDGDDVFDWPWLYAVEVGQWDLSAAQAAKLREYLLRGGFLMVDDFHGTREWRIFVESMQRVFPDRPIVELPDDDQIFHAFWDLEHREQIPGQQFLYSHRTYEQDGFTPRWRGIYDDRGRVMVAICHNMDLGDSVEHSDTPEYPERYSAMGMRTYLNYIVYALTH
ncbi:MAG TPA: DUF4159 domain-containing protein [Gammaproteobacteria bacterium]|nr:DUF4159 domain-containing protein [Gammaproteobacteria bacterium]